MNESKSTTKSADEALELLRDVEDYLGDRADVYDGHDGQPRLDRSMSLLGRVHAAIERIERGARS